MERVVRVRDLKPWPGGGEVCLELTDLLPLFVPDGHGWIWSLRTIPELVYEERWDLNIPFMFETIERERRGLTMSFEELQQFAGRVSQVIWGEFIAARHPFALSQSSASPAEVGREAIAGLLAIDSTYWMIGGPSAVIERVTARFSKVDVLRPEEWEPTDR